MVLVFQSNQVWVKTFDKTHQILHRSNKQIQVVHSGHTWRACTHKMCVGFVYNIIIRSLTIHFKLYYTHQTTTARRARSIINIDVDRAGWRPCSLQGRHSIHYDANHPPQHIVPDHTSCWSNGLVMNNSSIHAMLATTDYPTFNINRAISPPFKLYMLIAI